MTLVNVDSSRAKIVANRWGINKQFFPFPYLGVPLGGKPTSLYFWEDTIEKVHKMLSCWKYTHISKGEKTTLMKASLACLPTYKLSNFKALDSIYKKK